MRSNAVNAIVLGWRRNTSIVGARATRFSSITRRNTGVSRIPSRIHNPTPTMTMLSRNGIRQPQVRNWSPEIQLKISTAKFAKNSPAGAPDWRPGSDEPAILIGARPFHRQQHRAAPLAADADPLDQAQQGQDDRTPSADHVVTGNQPDCGGGNPGHQQCHDQGRLAADAVAVMAEDRGADRTRDKADKKDAEG